MKLIISLLLITSLSQASQIIITYESGQVDNAKVVRNIFEKKYEIPSALILTINKSCSSKVLDKRFLSLCINKKGELIKLSSNIKFQIKSLLTFSRYQ